MSNKNNNNNTITSNNESVEEVNTNEILRNTLGTYTHENWNRVKSTRRPEGRHLVLPIKKKPIIPTNNTYNPILNNAFREEENNINSFSIINSNINNPYKNDIIIEENMNSPVLSKNTNNSNNNMGRSKVQTMKRKRPVWNNNINNVKEPLAKRAKIENNSRKLGGKRKTRKVNKSRKH